MYKTLTYFSLVIAGLLVMATFLTATTFAQLTVAILFYPLLVYFALRTFPRKNHCSVSREPTTTVQSPVITEKVEAENKENLGVSNVDKRVFLKLIGGAGLSLLLLSILNKRGGSLFFQNLPSLEKPFLEDAANYKINASQNQSTDGYKISEIDENVVSFYGFLHPDGAWFIMREDPDTGSFRYARGDINFPGNWINRENLNYDYFNNIF